MTFNKPIALLIIVVAFAIGYLYYSQSQSSQLPTGTSVLSRDDLTKFKDLTIDFSVLDDAQFKSLRTFGESPVGAGVTGKRDIFAPF